MENVFERMKRENAEIKIASFENGEKFG